MRRIVFAFLALFFATPVFAADPVVSVWYRGTPAGTPRQDELAVIRALGFSAVTWPASQTTGLEALKLMAASAGLQVAVADASKPATPASLLHPSERIDIIVTAQNAGALTALAWRAVAHGTRALAFDSGSPTGAGLERADRSLKPWVRAAIDMSRQFGANARLIQALKPGPGVVVRPDARPALDVVMLDADRSWVLIATNTSADPVTATVRLPTGAPYAIWQNLLDGAMLAMNGEAAGPRWNLKLEAGAARVYLIDKVMK